MKLVQPLLLAAVLLPAATFAESSATSLNKVVAVVNDEVITSADLAHQIEITKKNLAASGAQVPNEAQLKEQILTHMIDVELQLQVAKHGGLTIKDEAVNESINKIVKANHTDLEKLKETLTLQGISFDEFKENIRREMLLAQLQQEVVGKDIVITDEQVREFLKNNHQQLNASSQFHFIDHLISISDTPSANEKKAALEKATLLFQGLQQGKTSDALPQSESNDLGFRSLADLPEVFAKQAMNMKAGEVSHPIETPNGFHVLKLVELKGDSGQHLVTLTHARHILLKTDALNTPEAVKKKLNQYRQAILKGKSFEQFAKLHSQDPGSATKGGDLGWVAPGKMVQPFETAMQTLEPGQVSKPIETTYGFHLIQVIERKKVDDSKAFQEQKIRAMLYRQRFTQAADSYVQQLRAKSFVQTFTA